MTTKSTPPPDGLAKASGSLIWNDGKAQTSDGLYLLSKSRIRHGRTYETEWEVYWQKIGKMGERIGIGGNKREGRDIAQRHHSANVPVSDGFGGRA